jgi:GNAT superfamily N-acetyltransferase
MSILIRPAVPAEADVLTALALASKRHWGYPESWIECWRQDLTITPDEIERNVMACAEDDSGRVLGFYSLQRDADSFRLRHLWLSPSAIGHGLGRKLFEHAMARARALGAVELVIKSDPNAEGFYRHMGARREGQFFSRSTGTRRVIPRLVFSVSR